MAKSGTVDLSKLSLEELQTLARDIETEIVSRREADRERVLSQMRDLAASLGLTLEEVVKGERNRGTILPKYRHPANPVLTWSGRGKRPAWVNEALAAGMSMDDLAVAE
jgi:DNA-binding protein H-NS